MADIEKRSVANSDDESLIKRQFFRRADVKGESRARPTKNSCANPPVSLSAFACF
jgi:hypothetical protein